MSNREDLFLTAVRSYHALNVLGFYYGGWDCRNFLHPTVSKSFPIYMKTLGLVKHDRSLNLPVFNSSQSSTTEPCERR